MTFIGELRVESSRDNLMPVAYFMHGIGHRLRLTEETLADLETIVEVHDQTDWHRMLGDVYMKAGRLSSALVQYRRALSEI